MPKSTAPTIIAARAIAKARPDMAGKPRGKRPSIRSIIIAKSKGAKNVSKSNQR
jgi:hypothetical protein